MKTVKNTIEEYDRQANDWRGYFMASTFLVEAVKE